MHVNALLIISAVFLLVVVAVAYWLIRLLGISKDFDERLDQVVRGRRREAADQ